MGIDKEQESRLISHETPVDDPTWGEVSAFLEAVESAYADVPTAQYEAAIVAAVSHEARSLRNAPQTNRRTRMKDLFTFKTHRLLIGAVVAAVVALTAGVGVAAATGTGPLAPFLPVAETTAPLPEPTLTGTPTEEPSATASDDDADDQSEAEDSSDDDSTPSATPTSHREKDEADESDDSSESDGSHSTAGSSHDSSDDEADDESDDSSDDQSDDDSSDHEKAGSSQDHSEDSSSDDSGEHDSED